MKSLIFIYLFCASCVSIEKPQKAIDTDIRKTCYGKESFQQCVAEGSQRCSSSFRVERLNEEKSEFICTEIK